MKLDFASLHCTNSQVSVVTFSLAAQYVCRCPRGVGDCQRRFLILYHIICSPCVRLPDYEMSLPLLHHVSRFSGGRETLPRSVRCLLSKYLATQSIIKMTFPWLLLTSGFSRSSQCLDSVVARHCATSVSGQVVLLTLNNTGCRYDL